MVDVRTLTVGSHVMVSGVMARVTDIESNYDWSGDTLLRFAAVIDGEKRTCGGFSQKDGIEPIGITEEVLKELGFRKQKVFDEKSRIAWVSESQWDALIEYNTNAKLYFAHFGPFNVTRVDYLHEAESAYYSAYGKELIKD